MVLLLITRTPRYPTRCTNVETQAHVFARAVSVRRKDVDDVSGFRADTAHANLCLATTAWSRRGGVHLSGTVVAHASAEPKYRRQKMFRSHGQDARSIPGLESHLSHRELRPLTLQRGSHSAPPLQKRFRRSPFVSWSARRQRGSIDHVAHVRAAFQKLSARAEAMAAREHFQKCAVAECLRCSRPLRQPNLVICA
jgi:hypothetical protein